MYRWAGKKLPLLLLAVVALLALTAASALADSRDFTLHNNSSLDIYEVYVSPSSSSDWESDVLGDDVLLSGNSVHITFDDPRSTCTWDVKVVSETGSEGYLYNVDLCSTSDVSFHD